MLMSILPIVPQKGKSKRNPSFAFRRILMISVLLVSGLSGISQMREAAIQTPQVFMKPPIVPKAYGEKAVRNSTVSNSASAASRVDQQSMLVGQVSIGSNKIEPTISPTP